MLENKNSEKIVSFSQPIYEDRSKELDEIVKYNTECEAKETLANESIIKIKDDLIKSIIENKRNFIITLIISILTLLVAIASLIVTLIK